MIKENFESENTASKCQWRIQSNGSSDPHQEGWHVKTFESVP